jgi:hypothetical protein
MVIFCHWCTASFSTPLLSRAGETSVRTFIPSFRSRSLFSDIYPEPVKLLSRAGGRNEFPEPEPVDETSVPSQSRWTKRVSRARAGGRNECPERNECAQPNGTASGLVPGVSNLSAGARRLVRVG